MVSQITGASTVYSTVCSDADQRKQQSSASLAFVKEIHRWPVISQHKWPVTRKFFSPDDVIMVCYGIWPLYFKAAKRNIPNSIQEAILEICISKIAL